MISIAIRFYRLFPYFASRRKEKELILDLILAFILTKKDKRAYYVNSRKIKEWTKDGSALWWKQIILISFNCKINN